MHPTLLIIFGFTFIFFMTVLGAGVVFLLKKTQNKKLSNFINGITSGIMMSASIWSLLIPALETNTNSIFLRLLPAILGLMLGGAFILALDKLIPTKNSLKSENKRFFKLFIAITLHNIPEGLSVGFVFGIAALNGTNAMLISAVALAVGIGLQNTPEGAAVALACKANGGSRKKAFFMGAASGAVEPLFATFGFFMASSLSSIQPWLLAFSAGAMIYVVCEEIIPDCKNEESPHFTSCGFMLGFIIMMVLDVCLG